MRPGPEQASVADRAESEEGAHAGLLKDSGEGLEHLDGVAANKSVGSQGQDGFLWREREARLQERIRGLAVELDATRGRVNELSRELAMSRSRGPAAATFDAAAPADGMDIASREAPESAAKRTDGDAVVTAEAGLSADGGPEEADVLSREEIELTLGVAYRSALAPGETGAEAWREAAARGRIVERSVRVRSLAASVAARNTIDRVEFALTRLSLMDISKADTPLAIRGYIRDEELLSQLDRSLLLPGEPRAVRAWLLEAKLILTGFADVP